VVCGGNNILVSTVLLKKKPRERMPGFELIGGGVPGFAHAFGAVEFNIVILFPLPKVRLISDETCPTGHNLAIAG
jgi:hypothetical protein